jgi:hypothetical protein
VPSSRVLRVLLLVAALLPIQWALRGLDTKDPAARAEAQTPAPTEAASPAPGESPARPNIVLIVTDDQRWDTLWVMPEVRRLLAQEGMTFQQAFVTNPCAVPPERRSSPVGTPTRPACTSTEVRTAVGRASSPPSRPRSRPRSMPSATGQR